MTTYEFKPKLTNNRRIVPTESQEMQILAQYLDAMGYLWFHPTNEGRRSGRLGARLKKEGMKAGVPDVMIFAPKRIAIELKRSRGGVATDEQRSWLADLDYRAGFKTFLAHGSDAAIAFIRQEMGR